MFLDFRALRPRERYKLMTATVVPRPIAFVSTRSAGGHGNAAPFSFFNVFSEDPPLLVLGLEGRRDGGLKHTTENILRTGEFAVNLVDEALAEAMSVCAADWPGEVDEIEASGLTAAQAVEIDAPRIAEAPVSFECRRHVTLEFSARRHLVVGEILAMHARDGLIDPDTLRLDWAAYAPVGRLYANRYIRTHDVFTLDVPEPAGTG
ncbi:flavin reductase family protein [Kaustia mangrovi]|uniref:Flavin reductase family protein n=1 Tax=Kaustia mangrovi TaxID=2593653 RepID=A0A7S8C550_9HYPH|nr:flavin reductase family protein [Kaustia mangrovi]QPC43584.1 flavin reductase family protein [Kaustia mangrovi]